MKTLLIVAGVIAVVFLCCYGFLRFLDWVDNCLRSCWFVPPFPKCNRHVGSMTVPINKEAPYKLEPSQIGDGHQHPEGPATDQGVGLAVDLGAEEGDQLSFEIYIPEKFDADELIATIDDTREMEIKYAAKKYLDGGRWPSR